MPIHVTTSTIQSLSNKTFVDLLSTTGVVYASGGNSSQWNSSYSTIAAQSANNASVFATVQTNSATNWNYQGTDIKALTANWQGTYTDFAAQSASNASVYSTVNANSATWGTGGSSTDLGVRSLTANWESTYTTVKSNSATWGTGSGGTPVISYTRWQHTAAAATSAYSIPGAYASDSSAYRVTINAIIQDPATYTINNVADTITFDAVPPLSADIVIIESTISGSVTQTMTANWESTYTTVQSNSANWLQSLSFNESNATLSISNGNSVSLSALSGSGAAPSGGGKLKQVVAVQTYDRVATTAFFPLDNTIPQITEGAAISALDVTITPSNASNKIAIFVNLHLAVSQAAGFMACLFESGVNDAISMDWGVNSAGTWPYKLSWNAIVDAASTSSRTYQVRFGQTSNTGHTLALNYYNGTYWGDKLISSVVAIEYEP